MSVGDWYLSLPVLQRAAGNSTLPLKVPLRSSAVRRADYLSPLSPSMPPEEIAQAGDAFLAREQHPGLSPSQLYDQDFGSRETFTPVRVHLGKARPDEL